jgi:hypothetical protein
MPSAANTASKELVNWPARSRRRRSRSFRSAGALEAGGDTVLAAELGQNKNPQ